jgi:hypothetical protein
MTTAPKNNRGPWLKDARKARKGEQIGGGFFVFRRGDDTGRIRPAQWPFEHPTFEAARAQAQKLASEMPGYRFDVVAVAGSISTPVQGAAE